MEMIPLPFEHLLKGKICIKFFVSDMTPLPFGFSPNIHPFWRVQTFLSCTLQNTQLDLVHLWIVISFHTQLWNAKANNNCLSLCELILSKLSFVIKIVFNWTNPQKNRLPGFDRNEGRLKFPISLLKCRWHLKENCIIFKKKKIVNRNTTMFILNLAFADLLYCVTNIPMYSILVRGHSLMNNILEIFDSVFFFSKLYN